jgi:protein transport protein HofQ
VRLKLHISENMPGQVLQQADGETLAIDKQEIETQVEVKVEKRWRWAEFFRRRTKPAATACRGWGKSLAWTAFSP